MSLAKEDADRMYRDAAKKVNEVMIQDLELWSEGFLNWAKSVPCVKDRLSHDDGELAYFFRPSADPNTTDWEIILACNDHRVDDPKRFLPGRGWTARAKKAIHYYLGAHFFYENPSYWEKKVREEAACLMEEEDMDEDAAINAATKRCKETYDNDGEQGFFICCHLCRGHADPDRNSDCKYNAWD